MNSAITAQTHSYADGFFAGLLPDPLCTVSEWADQYRFLSQRASAEPGQWRTERTPYLREIMDVLSVTSPVQTVTLIKGAQLGGTEAGSNWIGYIIDHAPGPMMAVQPTVDMAKRNSKQRIDPLISECKRLSAKVKSPRARDSGNTILTKEFPGGLLVMTGANSAVGLRSLPARYLFLDEVDGYPGDVDGEGDPVSLAEARTRTFARRKIFKVSTPTIDGRSRIQMAYDQSDQRKYEVPCPACGAYQELLWSQMRWDRGVPSSVRYICAHCEHAITESHKTEMLARGQWIARNPSADPLHVGFHINSLYSPAGWFSWADAATLWEKAQHDPSLLRSFVNTVLGETWRERGENPEWERLYERRETYAIGTVPAGGLFLTAGVDVQKDRIEYEIVAWGPYKESWSVMHEVIPGDTSSDAPWRALDLVVNSTYRTAQSHELPIRLLAIDTGYNAQMVYAWSRKYPQNKVVPIKGFAHMSSAFAYPKAVDFHHNGKKARRGVKVWPIGVNILKTELYGYLRQAAPNDQQPLVPGYCHFPQYATDYFQQLTAEELRVKTIRGQRRYEWEKIRDRNEALDLRVYAMAAAKIVGIDRFTENEWNALIAQRDAMTARAKSVTPAAATAPSSRSRRSQRSSYWDR